MYSVSDTPLSPSSVFTLAFGALLLLNLGLKLWLASRQMRHVYTHRGAVPAAFAQRMPLEAHQKAARYTIAQLRFGIVELAWGTALVLGWTLLGGLDWLNQSLLRAMGPGVAQQVALLAAFGLLGGLLDIPFALYRTFVIEQRFGFNKTTLALWVQDLLKSSAVGALIGLPLVALVVWMMGATGALWWLWTWAVWMGFSLLMMWIYPTWIAPLFNRFEPLNDAALAQRVAQLMQRCGFESKGLYVMDGSKRSAHANAYFTGFGAAKRVVFYDTLLAQLSPQEVDAVLAHELGHFHHGHIRKRLISTFVLSLGGLAVLGWLVQQTWFFTGLGVQPLLGAPNDGLALLLFMLVLPLVSAWASPLFAQLSRRHEFEADAYAVAQTQPQHLASALLKLYEDNASTLTPDPLYARFYYSHPPATERLARMQIQAA